MRGLSPNFERRGEMCEDKPISTIQRTVEGNLWLTWDEQIEAGDSH
jgi:hypothetical protein